MWTKRNVSSNNNAKDLKSISDHWLVATYSSSDSLGTAIVMTKIKQRPDIKEVAYLIENLKR